jgi:hypothetical protein
VKLHKNWRAFLWTVLLLMCKLHSTEMWIHMLRNFATQAYYFRSWSWAWNLPEGTNSSTLHIELQVNTFGASLYVLLVRGGFLKEERFWGAVDISALGTLLGFCAQYLHHRHDVPVALSTSGNAVCQRNMQT